MSVFRPSLGAGQRSECAEKTPEGETWCPWGAQPAWGASSLWEGACPSAPSRVRSCRGGAPRLPEAELGGCELCRAGKGPRILLSAVLGSRPPAAPPPPVPVLPALPPWGQRGARGSRALGCLDLARLPIPSVPFSIFPVSGGSRPTPWSRSLEMEQDELVCPGFCPLRLCNGSRHSLKP